MTSFDPAEVNNMLDERAVEKLNAAFKAAPEAVLELLLHRIPTPAGLEEFVPKRDDNTCTALGLFNKCVMGDAEVLALFGDSDTAKDCKGFDILQYRDTKPGRSRIPAQVPVYFMSQELFEALWDLVSRYAPKRELKRITEIAENCQDITPLTAPLASTSTRSKARTMQSKKAVK